MAKSDMMRIRLEIEESAAFNRAAKLAGLTLSTWVRQRLRLAAINELETAGEKVPFITPIPLGGPNE